MRITMKKIYNIKLVILLGLVTAISSNIVPYTNFSVAFAQEEEGEKEITFVRMSEDERSENGIILSSVEEQVLTEVIHAPGEVRENSYTSSQITSRISAQVIERHVKLGDRVKAGKRLVTLSSVEMAEAQGNLRLTQREWQRVQNLGSNVVSEQRFLETKVKAQQAMARVMAFGLTEAQAQEIIESDDASLASGLFDLYSMMSGTILQDDFVVGQFVEAGELLMKTANEESIWVEAQLPPNKASGIEVGAIADIIGDQAQTQGKVIQVHHIVDEESRTMSVRAEFDNNLDNFHSGEFVNIAIQTGESSKALAVSQDSLTILYGEEVVFKLEGEELHPVAVQTGRSLGGWTEILSGIRQGDQIVSSQIFLIKSLILKSKIGDDD